MQRSTVHAFHGAFLLCLMMTLSASAEPSAPAAPAPKSPAIVVPATQLSGELQAAIAKSTDPALGTIGVTDEYFIHQVHRAKQAPPAVHPGWTELHFILEGSGVLVTGGTIQGKLGAPGSTIVGGVSHPVKKGDAVIVPADTAHWYQRVDGSLDVLEVRFVSPSASRAP